MLAWNTMPALAEINTPTLILKCSYDEATQSVVAPLMAKIPNVNENVIGNGSHTSFLEFPNVYVKYLIDFLS
jgi:pimeloyl-ACP methyl ester carboxylesterase